MIQTPLRQNFSNNPDPQEKQVSRDDITYLQEQQTLPFRLPQSLVDWLARIQPGKDQRHQLNTLRLLPIGGRNEIF